jgi:hypothetical protein
VAAVRWRRLASRPPVRGPPIAAPPAPGSRPPRVARPYTNLKSVETGLTNCSVV